MAELENTATRNDATADQKPTPGGGFSLKRLWPVGIVIAGFIAFFALGLDEYVTFETLRENRQALTDFVEANIVVAVVLLMIVYAVATALSVPGGAVLTIAGGFLFGIWLGTAVVVTAATIGATLIFLIAKTSLGDPLRQRAGPWLKKMEAGFRENAISYLLVLRLIPLFPFFVVNLVPAFLGVRLKTYVIATFFGIIPGSFVYTSVGAGLGSMFESGQEFTASGILTPEIITALVGLAVLSLLPVGYKKWRARKGASPTDPISPSVGGEDARSKTDVNSR